MATCSRCGQLAPVAKEITADSTKRMQGNSWNGAGVAGWRGAVHCFPAAAARGCGGVAVRVADSLVKYNFLLTAATYFITRDITKAMSTLLVDYSCAIRLSAPICVLAAMRDCARQGIIVKGGKYLEELRRADVFVFDKTGTLTESQPKVAAVIPFGGRKEEEVLKLAAVIAIHDTIRQEAVDAIRELKAMGVREVVMLTGDGERTARAIASQAGITSYVAQALPDNGLHALPQLRRIGHRLERRIGCNNTVIVAINSLLMAGGLAGIVPATVAAMLHNSSTVAISMASMRPMVRLEGQP